MVEHILVAVVENWKEPLTGVSKEDLAHEIFVTERRATHYDLTR
ncbi:hypothetical protein HMPREF0294_1682 [Corynebacterium glucuronolyticum ATCC 51867]|nr:hypothetical protein HMPREF0294_1682 [Corynebacterium glucuronolyticum ATCC 51867]